MSAKIPFVGSFLYILKEIFRGKFRYCPFCNAVRKFIDAGEPVRHSVVCEVCNSFERHRFLYHVYQSFLCPEKFFLKNKNISLLKTSINNTNNPNTKINILHTAPEKCLSELILGHKSINYFPVDLEPEKFDFLDCKKEDVTSLGFEDNFFDVVLSNHVMEHIEDEEKFLSELLRVLKPDGTIFLTFPLDFNRDKTFEDENIKTPKDKLKFYGQEDHVRIYGRDILDKLKKRHGAVVLRACDLKIKGGKVFQKIPPGEFVVIIKKDKA